MGKRIRVQRRGRGSPTWRASTHKRIAPVHYPPLEAERKSGVVKGQIIELLHEPGRGAPLAAIELEDGEVYYSVVPEGVYEGQVIELGEGASVKVGNVLPVGKIPEGTMICNVELSPGDGGKIARSSGSYATVVSHTSDGTIIKLPSGKTRYVNDLCLATIGVISGAGRTEKPFLKAGAKFHWMKAKGHKYPRTRGRAMVAAVHPYGSSKRGARKVTTVSRHAPPGQKVGLIAAKSTGRKKKRRR
ncbi:50S ribosomal protein L2 [Candidatus Bathyarchaeota archaeon]|nr:MAG: 50S ribosomal protein L2 [Candidatus Bathyarchaeota archaeon ex4484_40]RJS67622.1 MAG: 50S ribosomal protein L2 [Candidatus Bathyarchaeota archaeon]RJS79160.1 MAG: 50S ribosomal protein L2 [Candidatus Bathyarchaeota archaeon]HDJ04912.1 50S ribosomal protein L2 [Candidatus Bathyarchaeota archaeon]